VQREEFLFKMIPVGKARAGIFILGTEVFQQLVEDFCPITSDKVEA
jgi:hypothetical protein